MVVVELQQKVRADFTFKGGHVVFGVAHVFVHQAAYGGFVFGPEGDQQLFVVVEVGGVELLALGFVGFFQHDQVTQQVVEELRHEAQQRVGAGLGQQVVEFEFGDALFALAGFAVFGGAAEIDVVLEGAVVVFAQAAQDRDGNRPDVTWVGPIWYRPRTRTPTLRAAKNVHGEQVIGEITATASFDVLI